MQNMLYTHQQVSNGHVFYRPTIAHDMQMRDMVSVPWSGLYTGLERTKNRERAAPGFIKLGGSGIQVPKARDMRHRKRRRGGVWDAKNGVLDAF